MYLARRGVCSRGGMHSEGDDPQTYKIIGAAMAVHRALGCGFLEAVSREALTIEFEDRCSPFIREARLDVRHLDRILPGHYVVHFLFYDGGLVELKSLLATGPIDTAQLINYLRISRRSRGLILNFGNTSLQHKRLVVDHADATAEGSGIR